MPALAAAPATVGRPSTGRRKRIRRFHRTADGRIQVWPSSGVAVFCSRQALLGAKDLARRMGAIVTIHAAESPHDAVQNGVRAIGYVASIGFVGPEVLAG